MNVDGQKIATLGEFLKIRRANLTPRAAGLISSGGIRRVSGLRREEVAQLASISVDYYTRLEQDRLPASTMVLAALARSLKLDDDEREYLYELAGKPARRSRRRPLQKVRAPIQRLLDQLTEIPALVLGQRLDILAWNAVASALYTDFSTIADGRRNYVRMVFTDPAMRHLYVDWEKAARTCVGFLRMEAAHYPDDVRLANLVGELSVQDPDFRKWWAAHNVVSTSYDTKEFRHPLVGELSLDCDTWLCPDDENQRLLVMTAEPESASDRALRQLADSVGG